MQVLSLIREENSYCEQEMARLDSLKGRIYDSMVGYMKETDEEVGDIILFAVMDRGLLPCAIAMTLGNHDGRPKADFRLLLALKHCIV